MESDNGLSKVSHAVLPNTAPYELQGNLRLATKTEILDLKVQELK